jgi:hypothetical protein
MTNASVEQAARNAVKEEIGDIEDMSFKQKNQLAQKFGVIPAYVTLDEIAYWEMREQAGDSYVRA